MNSDFLGFDIFEGSKNTQDPKGYTIKSKIILKIGRNTAHSYSPVTLSAAQQEKTGFYATLSP